MRYKLFFIFCFLRLFGFSQQVTDAEEKFDIKGISENRYLIFTKMYSDEVFIYDLLKDKLNAHLNINKSIYWSKKEKKLFIAETDKVIDLKTGKITSVDKKVSYFNLNTQSNLTFEEYEILCDSNSKLKRATETLLEDIHYNGGDYHSNAGSPPYNNDKRNPEAEQIRFNYPYLIDTLSNDSFGVFNLKKQSFVYTYKIPSYKINSANISPKRNYYYTTFKSKSNIDFKHYLFNISNNKYIDLNKFDTSQNKTEQVYRVSFSQNDSFFIANNENGNALFYKVFENTKPTLLNVNDENIMRVEFSPNSKYMITYSVFLNDTMASEKTYIEDHNLYSLFNKPMYHVKVWSCKTLKPLLDLRTSSTIFGFSDIDDYLAVKIDHNTVQTFYGFPAGNYSHYKDTLIYLSIIDLNKIEEIKQLNIYDYESIHHEYIWNRQQQEFFTFTADNKKVIAHFHDGYRRGNYREIYNIKDGKPFFKTFKL